MRLLANRLTLEIITDDPWDEDDVQELLADLTECAVGRPGLFSLRLVKNETIDSPINCDRPDEFDD